MSIKRILIIDDDRNSVKGIHLFLIKEGFEVTICNYGLKALQEINRIQYHLILLEVTLPDVSGFELLKKLRPNNKTPIILITQYDDIFEKIYGLEIGADDYLIKPINNRELLARINIISRRIQQVNFRPLKDTLDVNDISLSLSTREVYCNGSALNLTTFEFDVLYFLLLNAGTVVTKDHLSEYIHGKSILYNDRSIDMHISNIRKKISFCMDDQKIKPIRGVGYLFIKSSSVYNLRTG